jgi:hypothetical protein
MALARSGTNCIADWTLQRNPFATLEPRTIPELSLHICSWCRITGAYVASTYVCDPGASAAAGCDKGCQRELAGRVRVAQTDTPAAPNDHGKQGTIDPALLVNNAQALRTAIDLAGG